MARGTNAARVTRADAWSVRPRPLAGGSGVTWPAEQEPWTGVSPTGLRDGWLGSPEKWILVEGAEAAMAGGIRSGRLPAAPG
jgi:hypothetical protein